jgi:tRNA A37 N6-isopentenylltransferase MiaA
MNVGARKAKEALKKAQRQHQNEVKEAHRQLEIASKASSSRSGKRQKTQKEPKKPDVVVIQPELEMAQDQPKSRCGRTIRKPAHHGEK